METLAFIHTAVAYEDPNPESELRSFDDISLKAPGSIALGVLSAGVVTATLGHADQAQALISYGNRGNGVAQLQSRLGGIRVDGDFRGQTYDRVVEYQSQHSLRVDGVAGPETLTSLGLPPYLGSRPGPSNPNVGTAAYVTAGIGVNVRRSPGGAIVGGLPYGAGVNLTGRTQGGWSELTSRNWVASQYLSYAGTGGGSTRPIPAGPFADVRTSLLVRDRPGYGSIIDSVGSGGALRLTGATQFASGRSWSQLTNGGWVASDYIGYR